jgi:hypothetical protein
VKFKPPGPKRNIRRTMGRLSPSNKHFVIAYILLVVLPLLGLAGVLKFGRGLSAPISVDGVWKFATDAAHLPDGKCGNALASLQDSLVTLSQSGKALTVTVNNEWSATGTGVIEGTTLNATLPLFPASTNGAGCGSDNVLTLRATVDPKLEPRSMRGMVSFDECASCASASYQAVRQTRSSRSGGH